MFQEVRSIFTYEFQQRGASFLPDMLRFFDLEKKKKLENQTFTPELLREDVS